MAVRAVRLPAPPDRLDARRLGRVPARRGVPASTSGLGVGVCGDVGRGRRDALRRPGRRADLRAPLRPGGRGAVRRSLLAAAALALVVPGLASAHASLSGATPAVQGGSTRRRARSCCASTSGHGTPGRDRRAGLRRAHGLGGGGAVRPRNGDARAGHGAHRGRGVHGPLAGAVRRRSHRPRRVHVRRGREGAALRRRRSGRRE